MRKTHFLFIAAATLAISPLSHADDHATHAGPANATTQDAGRPGNRAVDDGRGGTEVQIDDQVFVTKAIEGSKAEVEMADLAIAKTTNPDVKKFAEQMKKDHTAAQAMLSQSASREGVSMPAAPNAEQRAHLSELAALDGAEFDRRYVAMMVENHDETVAMYSAKSRTGDGDVASIANRLMTVMNQHLDMARDLDKSLASSAQPDPRQGRATIPE